MWSMACDDRKFKKGSDEKGGPLLEKKHWIIPYCEKGLASIELYCLRSWNGYYIQKDTC